MAEEKLQPSGVDVTTSDMAKLLKELDALRAEGDALRARISELEELADTDAMTPVYNRRAFLREAGRILAFAERHDVSTAMLFLDLDGFKHINDRFGHARGDALLEDIAALLLELVRETDLVGRLGGDEFAVMLAAASEEGAAAKAAVLEEAITGLCRAAAGDQLQSGVTIGVEMARVGDTPEELLKRADAAMYAGKAVRADRRAAG